MFVLFLRKKKQIVQPLCYLLVIGHHWKWQTHHLPQHPAIQKRLRIELVKSVDLKGIEFEYLAEVQLPETNSKHMKMGHPRKKRTYSNHPFSGAVLVSWRVSYFTTVDILLGVIYFFWVRHPLTLPKIAEAFLSFEWKDVAHLWGSFLLNNGASNPENKNPDRQKYHLSWPEGFKSYKWFLQKLRCEMSFIQLQKERSKFKEQLGTIDVTAM